jgi:predicted NBD/HSP70 family sugar kinase
MRLALQTIYRQGPTSRAEIARETRLAKATVSDLVGLLLDQGLVVELGTGVSAGGKPPTLVSLAPRSRSIVALDMSAVPFTGAIADLQGEIEDRAEGSGQPMGEEAVEEVGRLAERLVGQATSDVIGVGVATPGLVDPGGTVRSAAHLDWDEVPLARLLRARIGVPVHVANDSHVAALAEYSHEFPEGESLVLVRVGEGVGAGIVLDGRLYRGPGSGAGEIGHVVVDEDGLPCWCGRNGCLETVVAIGALLANASAVLGRPASVDDLALPAAEGIVSAAGHSLGAALAHVVATLDVRHVALAGPVRAAGEPFRAAVAETIKERVLPTMSAHVDVRWAALDADLVLAGASAMVLAAELGVVWR